MKSVCVTIQMKATEQYFPVVLFIMLYKVVLTFGSVHKSLSVTKQWSPFNKTPMYYYYADITFNCRIKSGTLKSCCFVLISKDYSSSCIIPTKCVLAYQVTAVPV